jgi:hypothetical protein
MNRNIIKKDNSKENIKIVEKKNRKPKNTESFEVKKYIPDMKIQFSTNNIKYDNIIDPNDVILVPNLFQNDENLYKNLLKEVFATKYNKKELIIPWHEESHLIVDDNYDWKKDCPIFNYVVDKIANYFSMDIKATRMNWYQYDTDHKFFHHDAAAIKPHIAKKQNFTVGVSFGSTREIAFQVANHKDCRNIVSIPLKDGTTYCFSKDVNINWKHGVLPKALKEENIKTEKGRISIIVWGYVEMNK